MISGSRTLDEHIIDVHLHGNPEELGEDLLHQTLIGGPGILQTEGHNLITVEATIGDECSVLFVAMVHWDLIIPRVGIHEAQEFVARYRVYHLIYAWYWEAVLRKCII